MTRAIQPTSASPLSSAATVAGWSLYLAMSWTWCIGMFLPVILLRELGFWGVIPSAIPNILGAAAMGWIIRDRERSHEMVRENRAACVWFSFVTIAFHAFFAAWLIRQIAGPNTGIDIVAAFLAFWLMLYWKKGGPFLASIVALVVSFGLMAWGFARHDFPFIAQPIQGTRLPAISNLWLAPAWIVGFLLCPYLDLTFHAARQALSKTQSRAAFSIGFAAIFPIMLAFTVCYSGWLAVGIDRARTPQLALILFVYLIVQSCLTCALHARQVANLRPGIAFKTFAAFIALLIAAVVAGLLDHGQSAYNNIPIGEIIYRVFIGYYGLVAPAYVWLRLIHPRRSTLRVAAVIIIAAPLYWLAFANQKTIFILPGALIILLSKFLPDSRPIPASSRF